MDSAVRRFHRVFAQARRDYVRAANAILLEGMAGDTDTMESLVDAARSCTTSAINTCLEDIGRVTRNSKRARKRLLEVLGLVAGDHANSLAEMLEQDAFLPPVQKELAQTFRREMEQEIADFRHGWTAPAQRSFKELHPHLWDLLMLLAGAAVSGVVALIVS